MSIDEFVQWMCFYSIEPFGEKRADIQSAIVAQTVANIHRPSDKEPYRIKDFMPDFTERKPQSAAAQLAAWNAVVAAQNAFVNASNGEIP